MKTILKTLFASLMCAMLIAPVSALAQSEPKPAVVVSVAQMDKQLSTVNYLVKSAGFGEMGFLIKLQADSFLKGIDRSKPAGALMFFEEGSPEPKVLGFLPVSNLSDVLDTLSSNGVGEVEEGDDYNVLITDSEDEVFIKQVGDYAYIADSDALFKRIPSNPAKELGDLPSKYNVGVKAFGQRIPESLRDQALDLIRDGYEAQMEQMDDEDLKSALQKKNVELQMEQIKSFINETDYLTIGMNADEENKNLFMEMEFIGLEGSKLSRQCKVAADAEPTAFGGFLMEGAAFDFNLCSKVVEEDTEQISALLSSAKEELIEAIDEDGDLTEKDLDKIEGMVDKIISALEDTLKAGNMDGGGVVMLNDGLNVALGVKVASPKKVEDAVKEAVALLNDKGLGDKFTANLNKENFEGINMHEILVPTDEAEEEFQDMFGDNLKIYLGVGSDAIYAALGSNPAELLKKGIKGSKPSGKMPNSQYNVYLAPILKFAASIEGEEMMEMMGEKLAENGKDRIRVVGDMVKNGMKIRFEMQDGILELISVAMQGMGMRGGDDF